MFRRFLWISLEPAWVLATLISSGLPFGWLIWWWATLELITIDYSSTYSQKSSKLELAFVFEIPNFIALSSWVFGVKTILLTLNKGNVEMMGCGNLKFIMSICFLFSVSSKINSTSTFAVHPDEFEKVMTHAECFSVI
jgi:hypothetical protein